MHTCARANTPLRPPPNPRSATSAAHPLPLSRAARRDSDARSASLTDAGRGAAPVAGVVVRRGRVTTAEPQRATEGGADPAGARGAPSPPPVAYRRLFSFRDLSALWCRLPSPPPSIYGRRWPGWPLDHATTRSAPTGSARLTTTSGRSQRCAAGARTHALSDALTRYRQGASPSLSWLRVRVAARTVDGSTSDAGTPQGAGWTRPALRRRQSRHVTRHRRRHRLTRRDFQSTSDPPT